MFVLIIFLLICTKICNCIFCNDGSNPCQLDTSNSLNSYFLPTNGYYCLDAFNGDIICTCPDESSRRNKPCRICDREPNPCGIGSSVVQCTDINRSFSCLCRNAQGGLIVSTTPCDNATVVPSNSDPCDNQGVRDPKTKLCNCPSGFTGDRCETRKDDELCTNIKCMGNGICAIRPVVPEGTSLQSQCLCRSNTDGEYCENPSMKGSCISTYCLNGGVCQERHIGSLSYISCLCKPGWAGARCDKQYFFCQSSGYFIDEYMKNQGKYFSCISDDNDYLLKQKSCPKGLKFNIEKKLCLR